MLHSKVYSNTVFPFIYVTRVLNTFLQGGHANTYMPAYLDVLLNMLHDETCTPVYVGKVLAGSLQHRLRKLVQSFLYKTFKVTAYIHENNYLSITHTCVMHNVMTHTSTASYSTFPIQRYCFICKQPTQKNV